DPEPRSHHPEARPGGEVLPEVAVHPRMDLDPGEVAAQFEELDQPHLHVPEHDPCPAGLDALGAGEGDGDERSALAVGLPSQPAGDRHCGDRYQPDGDEPAALHTRLAKLGHSVLPSTASHISRGSKASAANMVMTTTAANATAPVLASTVASTPNCTSATRRESMKTSMLDQRPTASTQR